MDGGNRRWVGTGVIAALAAALLTVQVGHGYDRLAVDADPPVIVAIESALPVALILGLVALAVWVHRRDWRGSEVQTVARWSGVAALGMVAITGFGYGSQWLLRGEVHTVGVIVSAVGAVGLAGGIAGVERVRQRQQRSEVRRNEQRYRSLTQDVLDSSEVGIFILDEQFEVVWINEATSEYFGLDREQVIGSNKRELVESEIAADFEHPEQFRERVLATYEDNTFTEHFECHILDTDDHPERWLEHWSQPIETGLYAGGRIEHYTDITEQKRTERELEGRESQLRDVSEVISATDVGFDAKRERLFEICRDAFDTEYAGFIRVEDGSDASVEDRPDASARDEQATIEIVHAPPDSIEPGTIVPLSDAYADHVLAVEDTVQRTSVDAGMRDRLSPAPDAPQIGSYVVAPVVDGTDYHGAICLFDSHEREQLFAEWQLALLNVIADWIGSEMSRLERAQRRRQQLQEEREKVSALVEDVENYAIFTLDARGCVTSWNRGAEQITDYEKRRVRDEHFRLFFPDSEDGTPEQLLDRAAEEGRSRHEGWQIRADGSRYWADTTVTALTADGGLAAVGNFGIQSDSSVDDSDVSVTSDVSGYIVIVRDMTERRTRERRLNAVFNQTFGFTGLLEPDGTLLEVNQSLVSFGGFDREVVVGRALWELEWWLSEADRQRVRDAVQTATAGEFVRYEVELQGAEGIATVDFSINPVTDETGAVVLLVVEGRDITERKRRERRLNVLHRVLRHNLRNEMTGIAGYAEHLRTELSDPELAEYADRIHDTAQDVGQLSDRVKDIEETIEHSGERPPQPVGSLVSEVLEQFTEEYPDAQITTDYRENDQVAIDPRLQTAIEHVVENALEHNSAAEPTVRVRITSEQAAGRRWLRIAVADDGPGIPQQEREPIVEDEVTDLQHGSGLGLWVAKWAVESIGGQIAFEESDMGGATVVFRFPERQLD